MDNLTFETCLPQPLYNAARKDLSKKIDNIIRYDSFADTQDDLLECRQIIDTKLYELCCYFHEGKIKTDTYLEFIRYAATALKHAIIDFNRSLNIIRGPRKSKIDKVQFTEVMDSSFSTEYDNIESSPEIKQRDFERTLMRFKESAPVELYTRELDIIYLKEVLDIPAKTIAEQSEVAAYTVNRQVNHAVEGCRSMFEELNLYGDSIF